MNPFKDFGESGKPILSMRTAYKNQSSKTQKKQYLAIE
jgi:hypothetical protein